MLSEGKTHPRILAFDIMRGIFMTSIIINHLGSAFGISCFILLTGGGSLPASAAEGFFLLSGLMVGYVYGPRILLRTKPTFQKLWKREVTNSRHCTPMVV